MKKFLICIFWGLMLVFVLASCNKASSEPVVTVPLEIPPTGELEFKLMENGKEYEVAGIGTYTGKDIVIPKKYDGKNVVKIANSAFKGCTTIKSLVVPGSVTDIAMYAFQDCTALTSVTLEEGVKTIDYRAFYHCENLENITIPESITSIPEEAFRGCKKLLSSSQGITYLGNYVFRCNKTVGYAKVREGTVAILPDAFRDCTRLESLPMPDTIERIGINAFYGCTTLSYITIPEKVDTIPDYAFYGCKKLTSITLKNSKVTIGNYAFYGCNYLNRVEVANAISGPVSIGNYAFYNCYSLKKITFSESLSKIGNYAFYGCSALGSVHLRRIKNIGSYAFHGCAKLSEIQYSGTAAAWEKVSKGTKWDGKTPYYCVKCKDETIWK